MASATWSRSRPLAPPTPTCASRCLANICGSLTPSAMAQDFLNKRLGFPKSASRAGAVEPSVAQLQPGLVLAEVVEDGEVGEVGSRRSTRRPPGADLQRAIPRPRRRRTGRGRRAEGGLAARGRVDGGVKRSISCWCLAQAWPRAARTSTSSAFASSGCSATVRSSLGEGGAEARPPALGLTARLEHFRAESVCRHLVGLREAVLLAAEAALEAVAGDAAALQHLLHRGLVVATGADAEQHRFQRSLIRRALRDRPRPMT